METVHINCTQLSRNRYDNLLPRDVVHKYLDAPPTICLITSELLCPIDAQNRRETESLPTPQTAALLGSLPVRPATSRLPAPVSLSSVAGREIQNSEFGHHSSSFPSLEV